MPLPLVPLVMVAMNVFYAVSAYPFGKLSDKMSHNKLLALSLVTLAAADLVLAYSNHGTIVLLGVALWGIHMGMSQGLLAAMIAHAAPDDLRGSAYGFFNLASGLMMLIASVLAGVLWDSLGSASTFYGGMVFCCMALLVLWYKPVSGVKGSFNPSA